MKRIIRGLVRASCIVAAVWTVSFAPTSHRLAYAQDAVYYNGYGVGSYGGYFQNFGGTTIYIPNDAYFGFGSGPYGNYSGYGNPEYQPPLYDRSFRASRDRVTPFGNYKGF